jgi:hypothetical protein
LGGVAGELPKQASVPGVEEGYRDGKYFLRLSPSHRDQISLTGADTVLANAHVQLDVRLVATTEMHGVGRGLSRESQGGPYYRGIFLCCVPRKRRGSR